MRLMWSHHKYFYLRGKLCPHIDFMLKNYTSKQAGKGAWGHSLDYYAYPL